MSHGIGGLSRPLIAVAIARTISKCRDFTRTNKISGIIARWFSCFDVRAVPLPHTPSRLKTTEPLTHVNNLGHRCSY
jgi:hypothetical protein